MAATFTPSGEAGERLVALLNRAVDYLIWSDAGARVVDTATRARACAHRILGSEHVDTLRARSHVAVSYRLAGRPGEAIELGERVLADRERILGSEHPDTMLRAHLAVAYRDAGRTGEAIELREKPRGSWVPSTPTRYTRATLAWLLAGVGTP